MRLQINTDNNIQGGDDVRKLVTEVVESKLAAVSEAITRIEVHLQDQASGKSGANDKRCMIEARLEGRAPLSATHESDTIRSAVIGSVDKLRNVLDTELGKARRHR